MGKKDGYPIEEYLQIFAHNLNGPIPLCVSLTDHFMTKLVERLDETQCLTSARLFQLAFSSWRNSLVLGQAGALSQVPICLRHVVETCLYAYLFARDSEWEQIWWARETDKESKSKLKSGQNGPLQAARNRLKVENVSLFDEAVNALNHFIDFGAHPNVYQLVNAADYHFDANEKRETYSTALLGNEQSRTNSLISCLGSAFMMIDFYQLIWPLRYDVECFKKTRDEVFGQTKLFINAAHADQVEK